MAQKELTLSLEEAALVRSLNQMVVAKIEEARQVFQNFENQQKALLNSVVGLILDRHNCKNVKGNWSVRLANDKGEPVNPVKLVFEDEEPAPAPANATPSA